MTSPFERHGIEHLSASSCNLFAAEPALWILEKLLKRKGKVGAAAHRGNAVERGLALALMEGKSLEEAQAAAETEFRRLTALSNDPNREKEGDALAGIVKQALLQLQPYGKPSSTQRMIEWHAPDLAVPFIGYIDFEWAEHGIILDLKTQLRLSSQIARNHARQVAIYGAATSDNADLRLCYATPQKSAVYRLENAREHAASMLKIAHTIGRFLSLSTDAQELAGLVAPNIDSFYWSDIDTRQAAFEVFGI